MKTTKIHTKETRAVKWKKSDILALMVGHGRSLDGSWDSGCVYGNYTEAGLMLPIVKVAVKWLRKSGVKVITDADDANNRNMKASVQWANNKGARLYMSVHCDYKEAPAGVAPLYKKEVEKTFAAAVGKAVAKSMKMKYRGAFHRLDLYELNATNMTACVFETGSIKNDLKKLKDYKKYGKALAKAICKYIGVPIYVSKSVMIRRKVKAVLVKMKALKFKYKVSGNAMSWAGAKKQKTSNCSRMISYALQVAKILKPGQIFWLNGDKVVCKGTGTKKKLLASYRVLHPHKAPKKCGLKKGDICGYSNNAHTQMFAGWDRFGRPRWYSYGPNDVGKKQPRHKPSYDKKKIETILRLK